MSYPSCDSLLAPTLSYSGYAVYWLNIEIAREFNPKTRCTNWRRMSPCSTWAVLCTELDSCVQRHVESIILYIRWAVFHWPIKTQSQRTSRAVINSHVLWTFLHRSAPMWMADSRPQWLTPSWDRTLSMRSRHMPSFWRKEAMRRVGIAKSNFWVLLADPSTIDLHGWVFQGIDLSQVSIDRWNKFSLRGASFFGVEFPEGRKNSSSYHSFEVLRLLLWKGAVQQCGLNQMAFLLKLLDVVSFHA